MEGSSTRMFPRTELDKPVELRVGQETLRVESPANNLSIGGLYLRRGNLPKGAPVHVRIPVNSHYFEADGQIREATAAGTGIGFTSITDGNRLALDELIEELTLRGLPAA
ncbi:MAG TPA: PilZ domain-containing protein [Candidatus Sulfotelmatobacter sp.]|nr:PilZ domain-containing protein [Candidatus Sulfotelmatobacter sp.]